MDLQISLFGNSSVSLKKVKEIAKMLFINSGQIENKLEAKLKKQEIVFDTAVFHFELTFDNTVEQTNIDKGTTDLGVECFHQRNWILTKIANAE